MFFRSKHTLLLGFLFSSLSASSHVIYNGSSHEERSFYVGPEGVADFHPWPDDTVFYCFEADALAHLVEMIKLFTNAFNKWSAAFGGPQGSRLQVLYSGPCTNDPNAETMHVSLNNKGQAHTTLAFQGYGRNANGKAKNRMSFDRSADWGFAHPVSNMAHELGHAFGLIHEHQKWYPWHSDRLRNSPRDHPLLKFHCKNLKDYKLFKDRGANMDILCKNRHAAAGAGFSASEFLSYPDVTTFSQSAEFDFQSIMMYNSLANAVVDDTGPNPTLVRWNGDFIRSNLDPSELDGKAIQTIYPPRN